MTREDDARARAGIRYLVASGARAIQLLELGNGSIGIHYGKPVGGNVVAMWWLPRDKAARVGRQAHVLIASGMMAPVEAVKRAAKEHRCTLTTHADAMARAKKANAELEMILTTMRREGQIAVFNRVYATRRQQARSRGKGFLSYTSALTRLRLALIPSLVSGEPPSIDFASILGPSPGERRPSGADGPGSTLRTR
jgi:hypothetical protein